MGLASAGCGFASKGIIVAAAIPRTAIPDNQAIKQITLPAFSWSFSLFAICSFEKSRTIFIRALIGDVVSE